MEPKVNSLSVTLITQFSRLLCFQEVVNGVPRKKRPTTSLPLCLLKLLCRDELRPHFYFPCILSSFSALPFQVPLLTYVLVTSLFLSCFLSLFLSVSVCLCLSSFPAPLLCQFINLSLSLTIKNHIYTASIQQTATNVHSVIFNIKETKMLKKGKGLISQEISQTILR